MPNANINLAKLCVPTGTVSKGLIWAIIVSGKLQIRNANETANKVTVIFPDLESTRTFN